MRSLDEIDDRLAEREREQRARIAAHARPAGRPQTQRTRDLLRRLAYERHRRCALADPTTHPLRRARLTFHGDGLTIDALASRALVGPSLIQKIERGREASERTWRRLARALDVRLDDLTSNSLPQH